MEFLPSFAGGSGSFGHLGGNMLQDVVLQPRGIGQGTRDLTKKYGEAMG
jgi:hypothetical protein